MMETTKRILDVVKARLLLALFLRTSQVIRYYIRARRSTTSIRSRSNNRYVIAMETYNAHKSLWMIYFLLLRQLKEVNSQPFCSHMQLRPVETPQKCQTT